MDGEDREMTDDMTTVYMVGYHKRDDEIATLKYRVAELEGAGNELLGAIDRTPCQCHKAYTDRGLTAPDCPRCNIDISPEELEAARKSITQPPETAETNSP